MIFSGPFNVMLANKTTKMRDMALSNKEATVYSFRSSILRPVMGGSDADDETQIERATRLRISLPDGQNGGLDSHPGNDKE